MATFNSSFVVNGRTISPTSPTYFIADIAASHDGELSRAVDLIWLAKEAGADVAKFQHFSADTIVSDEAFRGLTGLSSHQSNWQKSVYEVYKAAEVSLDWTTTLKKTCDDAGITFFTSPYSISLLEAVDTFVEAHKIGSGDITWHEMIRAIAKKGKPYFLATGASDFSEVEAAVNVGLEWNPDICLMQCNTNYTGSLENFKYINLRVLKAYASRFPGMVLGLSDHTPGHTTVIGAVALGARVVEKHFTDDKSRPGPDHGFSMNPEDWRNMVDATRELEFSLGDGVKRIEDNEKQTAVVQRRSLCAARDMEAGQVISKTDLEALRPCIDGAWPPYALDRVLERQLKTAVRKGEPLLDPHLI